jgi:hypothetical protein
VTTMEMLQTHPAEAPLDQGALASCIEACFECAQVCTACADACLGERELDELVRCIRLDLDCADICYATGRMLSRQTAFDQGLALNTLQTCIEACVTCGEECEAHAHDHEHCRICADACRRCAQSCERLLSGTAL